MKIIMLCWVQNSSGWSSFSARGFCVNYEPIGKRTFWPCKCTLGALVFVCDILKAPISRYHFLTTLAWIRHDLSYTLRRSSA
jgi:hypothetical protein